MGAILTLGGRSALPQCPPEIAEEAELYARESGRTASVRFQPTMFLNHRIARGTWVVSLSLRPNDPRMKLWQEGRAEKPPTEEVWLHVPNPKQGQMVPGGHGLREPPYVGLNIYQLGAAGVRQYLERGNTWSGRGEHDSMMDALKKTRESNAAMRQKWRADQKEGNRHEQREKRRWRFRIPFLPVGIDLRAGVAGAAGTSPGANEQVTTEQ